MNAQQGFPQLSFVPAKDAPNYVQMFHGSVQAGATRISGQAARTILMKSKLSNLDLAKIWELADAQHMGSLTLAEFMLAMFLAQGRINGKTIPPALPSKIAAEIAAANNAAGASGFAQTNMPVPAPGYQAQPPPPVQPQIQSQMPVLGYQQQPQAMNVAMPTPSFYSGGQQAPTLVAPAVSAPVDVSPVQDFESRFPDIVPTGGVAASLSSAKQSFQQNLLSGRIGESEHKWAISTSEKAQYEAIFRRWDPGHRGVLKGDQAREVFAQSGLPQHELAKVWSLADINNQGELNLDEFSVAMHLIFRRIAGDQLPHALPQELVPRSSKDFMDSLVNMKEQLLFKDFKKTPVRAATPARAASVPIEEDEASYSAYKSANRRRNQAGSSRHGTSSAEPTPEATTPVTAESVEQLRKSISQRKDQIAALKASIESKQQSRAESRISARWRIDELKREIEDLHRTIPDSTGGESEYSKQLARRAKLARGIDELTRNLPSMVTDYERLATELAETKRDVVRKRDAKENPSPGVNTAGMTEMEARAARLVAQRMAALTGQTPDDANGEANDRIKHEIERVDAQQREQLDRAKAVLTGMESAKKEMSKIDLSASSIGDTSKWQEGVGVTSEEVKELIERLKRIEKISKPRFSASPNSIQTQRASAFSPVTDQNMEATQQSPSGPSIAERLAQAKTKQERDQLLKDMAEERFRERQRALGVPVDPEPEAKKPETVQQNSNPFAATASSEPPARPAQPAQPSSYSGPNFANSLELDNYSDTSSEEWDNDSDDEPEKPIAAASDVSFNTAFAAPEASASPTDTAAQVPDPNNPFHGLIAAASAGDSKPPVTEEDEKFDDANYQQLRLRALYPYHPDGADELPIETGDLVETKPVPLGRQSTLDHSDEGWMYGVILKESESDAGDGWEPSGKIGWFPKDYAETLGAPGSRGWNKTKALFGTAKYDYKPQHDDELEVTIGDRVRVVDGDKAESWWKVRKIGDKKEGMLPAMYIDLDE